MTIRYVYECNSCGSDYVEQRGNEELNPFFSTCQSCGSGEYIEVSHEILSLETEREPGPQIITEENNVVIEEIPVEIVEGGSSEL